jgi:hypothetical protein
MNKKENPTREPAGDLLLGIPLVSTFGDEKALDVAKQATASLERFAKAIKQRNTLFVDKCKWKPSLTLTFE